MKLLVLVPTLPELELIEPVLSSAVEHHGGRIEVCGFGIAAAASRSAQLLAVLKPERVLLTGIAGSLMPTVVIGTAVQFTTVDCYGIGVGQGDGFQSAAMLGWSQFPARTGSGAVPSLPATGDRLELGWDPQRESGASRVLVTVTAGSESESDVRNIVHRCPSASAEDMEGFGVALSCRLFGVPLEIIRGISNTAGVRDKTQWRVRESLAAAADCCLKLISSL